MLVKNSLRDLEDIFSSAIPAVEKSYRSLLRTVIMGNDTRNEECRLFAFENVSVNGFFEGTEHDISWHNVDDEFNQFAVEQLDSSTTLVFGRVTYELMADYWPTVTDVDPVAERMNSMEKVVVSTTMESADWNNTRLVSGNVVEEIRELKRGSGKDIAVLGSSNLTVSLLSAGLVDELRIMMNPILLGNGTSLFIGLSNRITLTHRSTKTFGSGNVLLSYEPSYK